MVIQRRNFITVTLIALLLTLFLLIQSCQTQRSYAKNIAAEQPIESIPLRTKIARMFLIGMDGNHVSRNDSIVKKITDYGVGGIILMTHNIPHAQGLKSSSKQLQKMCKRLQNYADYPLFIGVDQEGGNVMRLRSKDAYPAIPSQEYLGTLNKEDSTRYYADLTARTLYRNGININFAPCTDLNINPTCPVIACLNRAYSNDPNVVIEHANYFIEEHHKHNILTAIKHFPGHGSSLQDSHKGLTDISSTWQEEELLPYKYFIDNGYSDLIMVGHLFNNNIDSVYPASLSVKTINGLLRQSLGWNGVVITDDLCMRAIRQHYSLEETLFLAINAGVDILLISAYKEDFLGSSIDLVEQMVKDGRISESRINESFKRITSLYPKIYTK